MRESGLVTYTISLPEMAKGAQEIPSNAAAVVLTRPINDLNDGEIGVIDRYLKRGGSLFLMADVLFDADAFLKGTARSTPIYGTIMACAPWTRPWSTRRSAGKRRST